MEENISEKLTSEIMVNEIMKEVLISVNISTTCYQVAKMMQQAGVGAIIVNKNSIPVGIITDRDFATKIAANKYSLDSTVEQVMSNPLITIKPNDSIAKAASLMHSKKIRKLPVGQGGKIIGIITSTDIVNFIAKKNT